MAGSWHVVCGRVRYLANGEGVNESLSELCLPDWDSKSGYPTVEAADLSSSAVASAFEEASLGHPRVASVAGRMQNRVGSEP